jgi:hypothetical protein
MILQDADTCPLGFGCILAYAAYLFLKEILIFFPQIIIGTARNMMNIDKQPTTIKALYNPRFSVQGAVANTIPAAKIFRTNAIPTNESPRI